MGSSINSVGVHDPCHTHSLVSLQWSGLSDQWTLKTVYSARNGAPTKTEEWFLCPFVLKGVPTEAFLQPAKTAAMCMACCDYARPPPSIPCFLLAQNLSSKWIAPTDNMWSKLHDEYTHHQWFKGHAIISKIFCSIMKRSLEHLVILTEADPSPKCSARHWCGYFVQTII